MTLRTIIETRELAGHLVDPDWAIVDCQSSLDDQAWGRHEYTREHVPGAVFADLDHDLAGRTTGTNGRHPLPDAATLARTFSRWGVGRGVQVVAYDQESGNYASRLWWLLRWLGHVDVAVLNGGFAKWRREGRATRGGIETREPRPFDGAPRADMALDVEGVRALIGRADWRLLDARAPERYRGEVEPIDKVAGRIPGAANHPFDANLADGAFRSPAELRDRFRAELAGVPLDHVVCYCGSGVTACHNLLALEHAGLPGAKLYPGSWSEWSSDASRPMQTGESDRDDGRGGGGRR